MDDARRQELLQRVVAGDCPADAPEVQAAMARDPDFALRLRELLAVQRALDATDDDAATVERAATAVIPASDRARIAATFAPPLHRRWPWLLAVAAALVLVAMATWRRDPGVPAPADLGPSTAYTVRRVDDRLLVDELPALGPGQRYRVQLRCDGEIVAAISAMAAPIELPPAWTTAIAKAATARLEIFHGDALLPPHSLK